MAVCDWMIPVRLDLGSGPSDLKEIGRSKSPRTRSVSGLFWATRSRSDGPQRKERERAYRVAMVLATGDEVAARGGRQRCFQWFPEVMKTRTRRGTLQQAQKHGIRGR
jgi:hypothetical protein